MREYKSVVITLIAVVGAVLCVSVFTGGLMKYKKSSGSGITATGSASSDFESDLIVWRGSYSVHGDTPKDAYSVIKKDADLVKKYLENNKVTADEMVFGSINITPAVTSRYDENGKRVGDEPNGYDLTQTMTVTSRDIDKVEGISRDISTLIEAGVELESDQPEYYYTKLDDLKLDLIEKATANAKKRIDIIAEGAGSAPGRLLSAGLGVFQVTARNSSSESYSYDGVLDTSSRYKTAMITVRLNYGVK